MALEIRQSLKLTQSLIMTQKLQQAIKLLQLSRMELVGEITQALETNPVLEDDQFEEEKAPVEDELVWEIMPMAMNRRRRQPGPTARPNPPPKNGIGTAF